MGETRRKKINVTITTDGRDKGKMFQIEEMSAYEGEWWGIQAAAAIRDANPELGEKIGSGMQAIAIAGIKGLVQVPPRVFFDLGNDLIETVKIVRDVKYTETVSALLPDDIQEVETRLRLKMAALELNLGFSLAELMSKWTSASADQRPPQDS